MARDDRAQRVLVAHPHAHARAAASRRARDGLARGRIRSTRRFGAPTCGALGGDRGAAAQAARRAAPARVRRALVRRARGSARGLGPAVESLLFRARTAAARPASHRVRVVHRGVVDRGARRACSRAAAHRSPRRSPRSGVGAAAVGERRGRRAAACSTTTPRTAARSGARRSGRTEAPRPAELRLRSRRRAVSRGRVVATPWPSRRQAAASGKREAVARNDRRRRDGEVEVEHAEQARRRPVEPRSSQRSGRGDGYGLHGGARTALPRRLVRLIRLPGAATTRDRAATDRARTTPATTAAKTVAPEDDAQAPRPRLGGASVPPPTRPTGRQGRRSRGDPKSVSNGLSGSGASPMM